MEYQTNVQTKSTGKLVGLLIALTVLVGCQKEKPSIQAESRNGIVINRQAAWQAQGQVSNIPLKGVVFTDSSQQSQFQEAVRGLLSTDLPDKYVGYVSCRAADHTGVFFGGRVQLASGSLRNLGSGQTQVSASSELLLTIYDRWTDGASAPPIPPIYLRSATGTVSQSEAHIRFQDQFGAIELRGQFYNDRFQGVIGYENRVHHDGGSGERGTLGQFDIPVCDFFNCQ